MQLTMLTTACWWERGVGLRIAHTAQRVQVREEIAPYLLRQSRAACFIYQGVNMHLLSTTQLRVLSLAMSEPIALSEAKQFLRIDQDDDDTQILRAISVAREAVEQYLSTALLTQTLQYTLDYPDVNIINLPRGPATSITSIVSTDENGNSATWNAANYRVSSDGFSVLLKQTPYAAILTIQYVAGLAVSATALPALLKQGMLHHIAVLMEARDGSVAIPSMALQCYQPFRRMAV